MNQMVGGFVWEQEDASASPGINARVSLELGVVQPCNNESGWMIPRKIHTRGCNTISRRAFKSSVA